MILIAWIDVVSCGVASGTENSSGGLQNFLAAIIGGTIGSFVSGFFALIIYKQNQLSKYHERLSSTWSKVVVAFSGFDRARGTNTTLGLVDHGRFNVYLDSLNQLQHSLSEVRLVDRDDARGSLASEVISQSHRVWKSDVKEALAKPSEGLGREMESDGEHEEMSGSVKGMLDSVRVELILKLPWWRVLNK